MSEEAAHHKSILDHWIEAIRLMQGFGVIDEIHVDQRTYEMLVFRMDSMNIRKIDPAKRWPLSHVEIRGVRIIPPSKANTETTK